METIHVDGQRDRVPDWARAHTEPKITPRQRSFLLTLIDEREAFVAENKGKIDQILKCLRISEDPEEFGMSKAKASELITWFLTRPKKPKVAEHSESQKVEGNSPLALLPAGRYAIENNDGELRFYQCWESHNKQAKRIYVMHGPDSSQLHLNAQVAVAQKILLAGVRQCALRYGMEIGSCSNCGRRLTNRISRELAIGPICGGRMFGDEWKDEVKTKRAEIIARGQNPDEDVK